MKISHELVQEQSLKLQMTQDLIQAISLLELTSQELVSYLEGISLENPLIEIENYSAKPYEPYRFLNYENYLYDIPDSSKYDTLESYLHQQLLSLSISKREKWILNYLILNLNENGYLEGGLQEVIERLDITMDEAMKALAVLQKFDPPGIGARDLQECLLLQINRNHVMDDEFLLILKQYFQDFLNHRWNKITAETNISNAKILEFMYLIRCLNPKPGSLWTSGKLEYITPDVIIDRKDGIWNITLNEDWILRVNFNEELFKQLAKDDSAEVQQYLQEKREQYVWLKNSLENRRKSMNHMVSAIIELQEEYFLNSVKSLVPMTMKQIATRIGVHESTVSRMIKNKFIKTPRGTIPFKSLFSIQIMKNHDENPISGNYVRNEIKDLIVNEEKNSPYSDQQIVDLLQVKGIHIARRTVSKYREQLNIPSSKIRKNMNKAT